MPWQDGHPSRLHKSGWQIQREAQAILQRDGHRCYVPGCTRTATHVDHIVPLAQGGTDTPDNKAAICEPHHRAKTAAEAIHARAQRSRKRPPEPHPGRTK